MPMGTKINRAWLLDTAQRIHRYVPQLEDRVYYFPQGHVNALQQFPESSSPPYLAFAPKTCLVDCVVRQVTYDFPTQSDYSRCQSVIVNVTLAVVQLPLPRKSSNPNRPFHFDFTGPRTTRFSQVAEQVFTVTMRHCGLAEFLVLRDVVDRTLAHPWRVGMRISAKYEDGDGEDVNATFTEYSGTITQISDSAPVSYPHSPWEALEVRFDPSAGSVSSSDDDTRLSPWETSLFDAATASSSSSSGNSHGSETNGLHLPQSQCERIDRELGELLVANPAYSVFNDAVSEEDFPDYGCIVAVPMHVELIRERLRSNYYRQVSYYI